MQIQVLKGTSTIGGALTTITTSKGTKIELDMGMDLDDILRLPEIERTKYRRADLWRSNNQPLPPATTTEELTRYFQLYLCLCPTKQGA